MKKEEYWSEATIAEQAGILLKSAMSFRGKHTWYLNHRQCALLVLDMQRFFLDPACHAFIPGAPVILPIIRSLQDVFLNQKMPVIQTLHTNNRNNAGQMKEWWQRLISKEKPEAKIVEELADQRVHTVEKHQYDAFYKTDLEDWLKDHDIRQLVISGVMTHLCCETTARSAFVRGFEVIFVVDGTATYTRAFHQASLQNLAHGFAVPVLAQEIKDMLRGWDGS